MFCITFNIMDPIRDCIILLVSVRDCTMGELSAIDIRYPIIGFAGCRDRTRSKGIKTGVLYTCIFYAYVDG